ncbi:MAG TPA: ABC transporter permease/substrate-binding protein [Polyangiales bacterium]|jgi:osmoprotectant transport system permease protein|nr:ABC transporter permease/substrate-binding protein [Polyangiales bacterium]
MLERIEAAWRLLPGYLSQHVVLSACALALGLALGIPLSILALRRPWLRWPVLAFASLVQTIPSLALLALFYPLLLALSALTERMFGARFSALGFWPSLLALTLYSMLPILRNVVTAITNLDPDILEAADGVGMTPRQRLWRVELPLAAPMIMAGVRTAAVWVIGAATLSTPVGQTSLGNYIFAGLQVEDWTLVLFGCVAAAGLALLTDQMLGVIEHGVAQRKKSHVLAPLAVLLVGVTLAAAAQLGSGAQNARYVVGAKNFSEQYILARLISDQLTKRGANVVRKPGLGSAVAFRALSQAELDVYVDYSGTIWANVMKRKDNPPRDQLLRELTDWLLHERKVQLIGKLGFENAYALAMKRERAERLGIRSIADLTKHKNQLKFGGDFEFFARPEWAALQAQYELTPSERKQYQSTFMYKAVADGEVDVISAFSSDGRIATYDLTVLSDPKQAIPPYDAVLLVPEARARDPLLLSALKPLVDSIDIELMRKANLQVDRSENKQSPNAAAAWLARAAHID